MPPKLPPGNAVQVVSLQGTGKTDSSRCLKLNTMVLRDIVSKIGDFPIGVIAIAGPARGGKSFMLTYIVRYLTALEQSGDAGDAGDWMEKNQPEKSMKDKGFKFQNGTDRTTDGIWMWSRPFIINRPRTGKIAILLVDTEGCFDAYSSEQEQSAIIGLSLLTSSCFIFNEGQKINEKTLLTLATFMQYGQIAAQTFGQTCFQRLMFLVRDWTMPKSYEYGAAGGHNFVLENLKPKATMAKESQKVRESIHKCFDDINCYLMPHPGEDVISDEFLGSIGEMSQPFQKHVEMFVKSVVSDTAAKTVGSTILNSQSFEELFQKYVEAFNSSDMPSPASIIQAANYVKFLTDLRTLTKSYEDTIQEEVTRKPYISLEKLETFHQKQKNVAKENFDRRKQFGDPAEIFVFQKKFSGEIDSIYSRIRDHLVQSRTALVKKSEEETLQLYDKLWNERVGNRFFSEEEFSLISNELEETALQFFTKSLGNLKPTDPFLQENMSKIQQKLRGIREALFSKLNQQVQHITTTLEAVLEEARSTYINSMKALLTGPFVTPTLLTQQHNSLKIQATYLFKAETKHFKFPQQFIEQYLEKIELQLSESLQQFIQENEDGKNKIMSKSDDIVTDAVESFKEAADHILENDCHADTKKLTDIFDKVLKVGNECIIELNIPDASVYQACQRKLEDSLRNALKDALETLETSDDRKIVNCNNLLEEYLQKHNNQLKTIHCSKYQEPGGLQQILNQLGSSVKEEFQHQIFKIQLRSKDLEKDVIDRFDSHLKSSHQEIIQSNDSILQQAENQAFSLIRTIQEKYSEKIKDTEELSDFTKVQDIHNSFLNDSTVSLTKSIPNCQVVLDRSKKDLIDKLNKQFQTVSDHFKMKETTRKRAVEQALEGSSAEFGDKLEEFLVKNPSHSDIDVEIFLEDLVLSLRSELILKLKAVFQESPSLRSQTLRDFNELMEKEQAGAKSVTEKRKKEASQQLEILISSLLEDVRNKLRSSTSQKSLSPDELQDVFEEIRSETIRAFEKRCPQSSQKLKHLRKLKNLLNKELVQFKASVENLEAQVKTIVSESTSEIQEHLFDDIESSINDGKVLDDMVLENTLQTTLAAARETLKKKLEVLEQVAGLQEKYLSDFDSNNESKVLSLMNKNKENLKRVQKMATEICAEIFNSKVGDVKSLAAVQKVAEESRKSASKKLLSEHHIENLETRKELEDLTSKTMKSLADAKTAELEAIAAKITPELMEKAVKIYLDEMAKYSGVQDEFRPRNPNQLAKDHKSSVTYTLHKLKKDLFISEIGETAITRRLESSFEILKQKNDLIYAQDSNLAIGIDLGTTTCCVAIYQKGRTHVIGDTSGNTLIPSYVFFPETGSPITGHEAKNQAHTFPDSTIFDSKRLIGRRFLDPCVQEDRKTWPFEVVADVGGRPKIVVNGKDHKPEEISAHLLSRMKQIAADFLRNSVTKAVITVPASFSDGQKLATKQAAEAAGLQVLQIINEPTAAAMAYSLNWKDEDRVVLVYDFGGGTFDVSILRTLSGKTMRMKEAAAVVGSVAPKLDKSVQKPKQCLHVLATKGDAHLGGEDFDSNMVKLCATEFQRFNPGINLLQPDPSKRNATLAKNEMQKRLRRLRNECEKAKVILAQAETATVAIDGIISGLDLTVTITRRQFEAMNEPLFQRTLTIVEESIKDSGLEKQDIDDIILVGGSSRIPRVIAMLQEYFQRPSLNITQEMNIQEAVARGAAVQACILSGSETSGSIPMMKDLQPHSLGIETIGSKMSVIIKRNTEIPVDAELPYVTTEHNQSSANIVVYSGEDKRCCNNTELGRFKLTGIPPGPMGSQELRVRMQVDDNGILNVTGTVVSNKKSKQLTMVETRGQLTESEVQDMRSLTVT